MGNIVNNLNRALYSETTFRKAILICFQLWVGAASYNRIEGKETFTFYSAFLVSEYSWWITYPSTVAYSREATVFLVKRYFVAVLATAATTLKMATIRETAHMYIKLRSVYTSHKQKSNANIANLPLLYWKKTRREREDLLMRHHGASTTQGQMRQIALIPRIPVISHCWLHILCVRSWQENMTRWKCVPLARNE